MASQKFGVLGAPGIGKSGIFARGDKTLVIQTEAGLNHIKCMKLVCRAWSDWEDIWSAFIKAKTAGTLKYDTIGIDTVDNFVDKAKLTFKIRTAYNANRRQERALNKLAF